MYLPTYSLFLNSIGNMICKSKEHFLRGNPNNEKVLHNLMENRSNLITKCVSTKKKYLIKLHSFT
ncbi:hypothetical protein HZS_6554 [Henneguya salminicola]|nr:hypothetical protein HZS_6554 [Henneguya salminicola]